MENNKKDLKNEKICMKEGRVKILQVLGKNNEKSRKAASVITVFFIRNRKMKSLLRGHFNINISHMRCNANVEVEALRGHKDGLSRSEKTIVIISTRIPCYFKNFLCLSYNLF